MIGAFTLIAVIHRSVLQLPKVIHGSFARDELFLSVSRTGSFTETGRLFGVSSTSVSRMITDSRTFSTSSLRTEVRRSATASVHGAVSPNVPMKMNP